MTTIRKIALMLICSVLIVPAMFANSTDEAGAVDFPRRQIQNIFPWSPGMAYAVSQIVAAGMGEVLGQNVVVTSTTGASGVKAAMTVMGKPADGYTIFDGYVAPLVLAPLFGNADYTYEDFKPLYGVASNAFAVVSRKDETRWTDLPSFLEYAKKNPGQLKYSSGADISLPHMAGAAMLKKAGAVCRNIPYNDTEESYKEFLSGELDFMIMNAGGYKTNKDNIVVLAVLSDLPMPEDGIPGPLPKDYGIDIGLEGLAATGWTWWVVRKETPDEVVEILRDAMGQAMRSQEVIDGIKQLGFAPLPADDFSPEMYAEKVQKISDDLEVAIDAIQWEKDQVSSL